MFHEAVLTSTERPTLLILFATMMGLPAFLWQDAKKDRPKELGKKDDKEP